MNLSMQANFKSFDQLGKNLDLLVEKTERQAVREAASKAATPMVKAIKNNIRSQSGLLKRSIKKKVRTYKRAHLVMVIIGPDRNVVGEWQGEKRWPVKYAHLVEVGPNQRPFMRPAYDSKKNEIKRKYAHEIGKSIKIVAKRVNRRVRIG